MQLAKAFGAHVTGVCSTRNLDLVRSLGADEVVDYIKEDFTRRGRRYDLLVDIVGSHSAWAYRRALARNGAQVIVGGPAGRWLQPMGRMFGSFGDAKRQCLLALTKLIEDGKVTPVIDRRYPFEQIPEAVRYSETGRAAGKVVVST